METHLGIGVCRENFSSFLCWERALARAKGSHRLSPQDTFLPDLLMEGRSSSLHRGVSWDAFLPELELTLWTPHSPCSHHVVVQSLNPVWLFSPLWTTAPQASLFFTVSRRLLKLMSIESVMPSNHLILCHPLLHLLSVFPSIKVFSTELAFSIRWPKYSYHVEPFYSVRLRATWNR